MYFTEGVWKAVQECKWWQNIYGMLSGTQCNSMKASRWQKMASSTLQNKAKLTDLKYKMCSGPDKMANSPSI